MLRSRFKFAQITPPANLRAVDGKTPFRLVPTARDQKEPFVRNIRDEAVAVLACMTKIASDPKLAWPVARYRPTPYKRQVAKSLNIFFQLRTMEQAFEGERPSPRGSYGSIKAYHPVTIA